jgi:PAS domain S-box-containing protein
MEETSKSDPGVSLAATAVATLDDRLRSVLESITDGFFGLDPQWHFHYVNQAAERFLRRPRSELLGQTIWAVFPEAIGTRFQQEYEQALRTQQAAHFEEYYPPMAAWFEVHAYPSAHGLAVYFRDITERRKVQEANLRAKQDWERTFDSVPDLIAILDSEHRVVRANRAMAQRLGMTAEQCIGQFCYQCVHGSSAPPKNCPHVLTLQDGREHVAEVHEPRLKGDFLISTTPLLNEQGVVVGSVHVARDITEQKRAEQALQAANDQLDRANLELEEKVRERTAKLRETVGDLEQFSYSISHDMRAPLRTMGSFSELLLQDCQDKLEPQHVDYLRRISSAAQRMDNLIRDVLTFSRIARGELTLARVDPGKLLHQIVEQHYPHLSPDQAEMELVGPWLAVQGNEALLSQCLSNLLDNALKFVTPGKRIRVRVWTEARERWVRLSVRDNGIGIGPDQLQRIWRLFERGHHQGEYSGTGTGLGLSVVKRAVERMDGRVGVDSEPDQGSTFWFELPGAS